MMRSFTRTAVIVVAGLSLFTLAGCAAPSPEDQAKSMYRDFVKQSTDGGKLLWCDEVNMKEAVPSSQAGDELEVLVGGVYGTSPELIWVSGEIAPVDAPDERANLSVVTQVIEGEETCISTVHSTLLVRP